MTLTLDHIQRLNLHALLGAQRGDVATYPGTWARREQTWDLFARFGGCKTNSLSMPIERWNSSASS